MSKSVLRTKDFEASVKAVGEADGLESGTVRMLVSVFDNVDSVGDVVIKGAFTNTLAEWKAKGDPIPFVWSHQWKDPFSHIGYVTDAKETDRGLEVEAKIDLDTGMGKQVYGLLKQRRITQASFAYGVEESAWVEREAPDGAKYEVFELRELSLIECGPCLVGANQETELLEAKAREAAREEVRAALAEHTKTSGTEPDSAAALAASEKSAQARARLTVLTLSQEGE